MKRAGLVALILGSTQALADERLEARRHFRNGMALVAQGQLDSGVAELQEAYAIKPHPNVLYNIARAYHDAGRIPEAVDWYKRYLTYNPADSEPVRVTLAQLEKSLQPAAPAPGELAAAAVPQLQQPQQAAASAAAGSAAGSTTGSASLKMPPPPAGMTALMSEERAKQLASLLERLEKAVDRAEATQQAQAQAQEPAAPLFPVVTGAEVALSGEEAASAVPYEEQVVTASRRAQSSLESPNAMTVITAEDIRLSGATNLVELMRRVPGADVMALGVGSANVSFRGFNQRIANKVLVLVDGRSEYQDFMGTILWDGFTIGLEEIERIEVIRGPGSALYGANAMLGVVNIITKAPGSGPRGQFNLAAGAGNTAKGSFVSFGGDGAMRYRASVGYGQANKWSRDYASDRPDMEEVAPSSWARDADMGSRTARANVSSRIALNKQSAVDLSAGVNRFYSEVYPLGTLRNYNLDGYSINGKADLSVGPVKLKTFWNHLETDAGPEYEAIGTRSLATRLNANVVNTELVYSDGFQLVGEHQATVGVEGRLKRVDWDYVGGKHQENHFAAFLQDEWQLSKTFRLVGSYRVDSHPLLDNGKRGLAHSPRVSALIFPFEGQAFRVSLATAFREPTFLESYTALRVPAPGVNGASVQTVGNPALRPERLTAYEFGYRGEAPTLGMEWDVALYQNTVKDLIVLSAVERLPAGDSYDPVSQSFLIGRSAFTNEDDTYVARGGEVSLSAAPLDGLGVKLGTGIQKISSDFQRGDACVPCRQAPGLKLFGALTYRTRRGLELGTDATYTSSTRWIEREPSAADPTQINLNANALPSYTVINARVGYEAIKDRLTVALVGTQLGNDHFEHPFGNRIERRVLGLLTVTP
ncbi:TonB-dependent receptor domain-containing protein [Aggregicoccus sp. 17bor-14]|uniref:TonB-dependent receptor plug domain-containing protein n=1 Tax=Myxococcaceae TaxID=31 RepID=UPI00351A7D8A